MTFGVVFLKVAYYFIFLFVNESIREHMSRTNHCQFTRLRGGRALYVLYISTGAITCPAVHSAHIGLLRG